MSTTIEQIKERLDIVSVIGSYITLEKSGGSLKARCPFHNEKSPSFFVSPDRGGYYCFGCGAKGDIFSFVENFEGLDFVGALKLLAERAGVTLQDYKPKEKDERGELFEVLDRATVLFQKNLSASNEALIYLKKRGLSIEMVRDWKIGFALDEWRSLKDNLLNQGFSENILNKAGLIKNGDKGFYDRFRGRIMFPIFDSSGRVVGFSGRILKDDEHEAKYLNSPETPLFEKSKLLYGLHKAKLAIKEKGFVILVEGQMDLLMSHQGGFANTVASSGTALTPEHIALLKRFTDTVVIAYDGDSAGQNASFKAWQIALRAGLTIKAISISLGKDPAEIILHNKSLWKDLVDGAMDVVDYYIEIALKKSEMEGKNEGDKIIKDKILPLIQSIESAISKSRFIQKLSFKTGIPEKSLWEELSKVTFEEVKPEDISPVLKKDNSQKRRVASFYLFTKNSNSELAGDFEKRIEAIDSDFLKQIPESEAEKNKLIFEGEMHYGNSPNLEENMREVLSSFEEEILREKFTKSMEDLKKAEFEKDVEKVEKELKNCQEISQKLSLLSKKYGNQV